MNWHHPRRRYAGDACAAPCHSPPPNQQSRFDRYDQRMGAVIAYIVARTGLPLYDFR
jgi:hypothetical protein